MTYQYTKRDLLKIPQKYQQSQFEGKEFLDSYFKNRREVIEKTNCSDKTLESIENELKKIAISSKNDLEKIFIKIIYDKNTNEKLSNNKIIDIFLKKFEIKKRVMEEYDSNNKEKSDNFYYLRNYLLISILCCLRYRETKNLKFLNTILKINDTLISQFFKINEILNLEILSIILRMEIDFITELYTLKGLNNN